jgi:hypothetical protein
MFNGICAKRILSQLIKKNVSRAVAPQNLDGFRGYYPVIDT